ncbi:unnamed protein product [Amoebophrya sp. A120]|nr:unnamed protein product [Amoebophrya sp. A120]|eukprot:GSA120T00001474001.1
MSRAPAPDQYMREWMRRAPAARRPRATPPRGGGSGSSSSSSFSSQQSRGVTARGRRRPRRGRNSHPRFSGSPG